MLHFAVTSEAHIGDGYKNNPFLLVTEIQKCNHAEIYQEISDENLELMRERLKETVIWPSESDDSNTEKIG